jgi:hypothetical protein
MPLVAIDSREEARTVALIREASLRMRRPRNWGVFVWSATDGLKRLDIDVGPPQRHLSEPGHILRHLKATPLAGIYILLDFHPFLADAVNVRTLKDVALGYDKNPRTVVLVSHEVTLPPELESLAARFRPALPSLEERTALIERVLADWRVRHPRRAARIERASLAPLAENLAGLSASDAERLVRAALYADDALTLDDVRVIQQAKNELLNRSGTLVFEPDTARFADVGGLANLKRWIEARRDAFKGSASAAGAAAPSAAAPAIADAPRGLLLLGVQGCGKSLAARATAGLLGVPLLRFDFAALYSKWQGESERNLRESLATAEALAPCVLWVDEIEKALARGEGDSGVSQRVFGAWLTWMAERRAPVFVVATANDVSALPPELLRKGRFDEIFFVDLPDQRTRADILGLHAVKRGLQLTDRELAALAALSVDFSGAELEQAIVAARYSAQARGAAVGAQAIAEEIRATRPLAVVMAEQVEALRAWARDRTVRAD